MNKSALISVYDKEGIIEFAASLNKLGFNIVSTGGTNKYLLENNIETIAVEEITKFPEILNGRVKTLHPHIFASILSDRRDESHLEQMNKLGLTSFDLVVVNLYPFSETIKKDGVTVEEAIEQIDIGGVSLIRAAGKNFQNLSVIVSKDDYQPYIEEVGMNNGRISFDFNLKLVKKAFDYIANYDVEISNYFGRLSGTKAEDYITGVPKDLRYGENPHQKAIIFKKEFDDYFQVIHGKELSYNNILDIDAAISIMNEFKEDEPTTCIIKHGNPCGAATDSSLLQSYKKAYQTDTVSPFGGIVIFNKMLDIKTAAEVDSIFTEILLAPEFEESALDLLKKKKNRRLIKYKNPITEKEVRSVHGGLLIQEKNGILLKPEELKYVTKIKPDNKQLEDLIFAYKVVKHTKSNAVIFAKDKCTLGIGAGQPSRVDSTKIAVLKAHQFGLNLKDSIVASDAFFPFADSLDEISNAGAISIIQPGGSVRDNEVIEAADRLGISMVFTGYRHFRH